MSGDDVARIDFELKGPMRLRHAVLYDPNPTVGEEATVTLVDGDGNVESVTHIYEEPDDWNDDVLLVKPLFTPKQRAKLLEGGTPIRVSLRTEK